MNWFILPVVFFAMLLCYLNGVQYARSSLRDRPDTVKIWKVAQRICRMAANSKGIFNTKVVHHLNLGDFGVHSVEVFERHGRAGFGSGRVVVVLKGVHSDATGENIGELMEIISAKTVPFAAGYEIYISRLKKGNT